MKSFRNVLHLKSMKCRGQLSPFLPQIEYMAQSTAHGANKSCSQLRSAEFDPQSGSG